MKKTMYIGLFIFCTLLVSFVLHALLEIATLSLLTSNLDVYGNSYIWQNWALVHRVAGGTLTVLALLVGSFGGWRCWQILYVEERYGTPRL